MSYTKTAHKFETFDTETLPYLQWKSSQSPNTVIVAVHGINGAADDYENLAEHLLEKHSDIAIYAAETRGQGNDPVRSRRGDIYRAEEWYKDLYSFTEMVREKHPTAKLLWCGESMGSLIVTHAFANLPSGKKPPCDGIILLAPVVNLTHQIPLWKYYAATTIAALFPRIRIKLNSFAGKESVQVTQGADSHDEQAATNSYFISKFTLRLLGTLGKHIRGMNEAAKSISVPILVSNGGKDYFTPEQYVPPFVANMPAKTTHQYYPEAYHLLMYDDQRDVIFCDVNQWIEELD